MNPQNEETNQSLKITPHHFKPIERTEEEQIILNLIKTDNFEEWQEKYESPEELSHHFYDDYTTIHIAVEFNSMKCLQSNLCKLEVPLNMVTK